MAATGKGRNNYMMNQEWLAKIANASWVTVFALKNYYIEHHSKKIPHS